MERDMFPCNTEKAVSVPDAPDVYRGDRVQIPNDVGISVTGLVLAIDAPWVFVQLDTGYEATYSTDQVTVIGH
jgi:hypothetical protein